MSDDQSPVRGIPDFPEDLSSVEAKSIDSLKAKVLKDFERLDSKSDLNADEMEHLGALNIQLKAIRTEEGVRADKKAETDSIREQIRREMAGEADPENGETVEGETETETETVEEVTEPVEGEPVEGEPEAVVEVVDAAPAIAASVRDRLAAGSQRPGLSTEVRDRARTPLTIVASAGDRSFASGAHISADDLSEALVRRARSMGVGRGSGEKAIVASVERTNPINDIRTLRGDREIIEAFDKAHNQEALVASGGWCSPSETQYDFACDYEAMPDGVDLVTLTANRGGVRVPEALKLSDFLNEAGIGMEWTEADDIAAAVDGGPVKVCASIPCPDFLPDVRLEAFYTCLKAGNLIDRSWPELVNRTRDLSLTAHAHRMNALKISKMVAASTLLNPVFAPALSATEALLSALEFELARFRDAEFTDDGFTLEAIIPRWVKHLVRRDLARRGGVDFRQVSDADITGYFSELGIRVQWVTNYQMLQTAATEYPTSVEILLYPAGAFTLLDGGSLDIAVIRDSVLNATNDHTLLFFEEFWQILSRCASYKMNIPVCATGATGAPAAIVCPTV